ncbi:MAG TPA: hypothetical protein VKB93_11175 [Thermoanaerobaculia bacterium]|nr:hypothetical protein [Thermoanaerobaculia bacterium]
MKRTAITLERERLLVVRRRTNAPQWCRSCRRWTVPMTVDEVALLCGVTSRAVFQWVEAGAVHSDETAAGLLRICSESIP